MWIDNIVVLNHLLSLMEKHASATGQFPDANTSLPFSL